jgi:8-oxo-dGTP pyrophosphatase MutT (NUDIX family)
VPVAPRAPGPQGAMRAAATMMVVRDGASRPTAPLEVLMLLRTISADFMGGAYVFPGGGVDDADRLPTSLARCGGRDDASVSAMLGLAAGGLAYWVAALRECFEEAGLLLAHSRSDGTPVSFADPEVAQRFVGHRHDVNTRRRRFLDVLADEDLELDTAGVHYFAHWITPEGAPRRYDTRFFVARAPQDQTPVHDAGETVDDRWLRPADALALHAEGQIELIFPTIKTLQAISRFDTADQLIAAAARMGEVPAMLPRLISDGRGMRILLPGDPGYADAALGPPPPVDQFDAATRAVSRAAALDHPLGGPDRDAPPPSR